MVLDVSKFSNQYLYTNSHVVLSSGISALRVTLDKSDSNNLLTNLTSSPQAVTTSYVDVGSSPIIKSTGYDHILLYIKQDVNSSENVNLKAKGLDDALGTTPYDFEVNGTKSLWTTSATDSEIIYKFDLDGVDYIKFQVIAGTLGITPAYLTGGTSAQSTAATWEAVTDGEFSISIDGTDYDITGIDFTGDLDMDDVAATLQAAIRAETGNEETVTWSTDHFIINSVLYSPTSAVSVTSSVAEGAGTDISGAGTNDWMDSDTGNGTETAVAGTAGTINIKYKLV